MTSQEVLKEIERMKKIAKQRGLKYKYILFDINGKELPKKVLKECGRPSNLD